MLSHTSAADPVDQEFKIKWKSVEECLWWYPKLSVRSETFGTVRRFGCLDLRPNLLSSVNSAFGQSLMSGRFAIPYDTTEHIFMSGAQVHHMKSLYRYYQGKQI